MQDQKLTPYEVWLAVFQALNIFTGILIFFGLMILSTLPAAALP